MNLILLGGMSKSNQAWIEDVDDSLADLFLTSTIQYYRHWQTDGEFDIDHEIEVLHKLIKNHEPITIFAKSAGTWITMKALYEKKINPVKCIFCGTALIWGKKIFPGYDKWLKGFAIPTLYIQKTFDPAASFLDVKKSFSGLNRSNKFVEIPGNDHHYGELAKVKLAVKGFI